MLKNLPRMIGVSGALILILSVAYDYGFFYALGTSFLEMPTTLSDHLRSSLNFIPYAIIILFPAFVIEMLTRRVEQGMTEEEIIKTSSSPEFVARFRYSPMYGLVFLALLFPLALFFNFDVPISSLLLLFIILWFAFNGFLFGHSRIRRRTSKEFILVSMLTPPILAWCAFHGFTDANEIKEGGGPQYVLVLEKKQLVGTLARSFDKYYLIWDKHQKGIMLVSTEKVVRLYPKHN